MFTVLDLQGLLSARGYWRRFPLELRQRYWRETDYGKNPMPPELQAAIAAEIKRLNMTTGDTTT